MHPEQTEFVYRTIPIVRPNWRGSEKVVEIGSYNVNGSIREAFDVSRGGEYVGVDLMPGPGVDVVYSGETIEWTDGYFDVAISCECFEHNPKWLKSFQEMCRISADDGCVMFTCASSGRGEHGTRRTSPDASPGTQTLWSDYYKNLTADDFEWAVDVGGVFSDYRFYHNDISRDLYFVGVKRGVIDKPVLDESIGGINRFVMFSHVKLRHYPNQIGRLIRHSVSGRIHVRPVGTAI